MTEHESVKVDDKTGTPERKSWSAPKMTVVEISNLTEHMFNPGNDGGGTSSFS